MRITEIMRSVLLGISVNKFRVFLTSLGIIIGAFTIIMVVGIGKAGEAEVSAQFSRLSVESITIARTRGSVAARNITATLTRDDAARMVGEIEQIKAIGVSVRTSSDITAGMTSSSVSIMGIDENYASITNLDPLFGSMFTDEDSLMRARVAVLGYTVATDLFGDEVINAVGETVRINGASFTVAGVFDRVGGTGGMTGPSAGGSLSPDDIVYIPYDVALKYTAGTTAARSNSNSSAVSYVALAQDIASVAPAIEAIEAYILQTIGTSDAYTVTDAGSVLESAQATARTMSSLLIAVAIIVLIVSGIGIMNVLLVAVQERTREIGILKSIGASRRTIMVEFLLEAVVISIFGGLAGVGLSAAAPLLLSGMDIAFQPSLDGILLGLGFAVLTGIVFGFYPAAKASGLKPIDALNYE